eukprot:3394052-Heterocapsa_arctica.AAC.1
MRACPHKGWLTQGPPAVEEIVAGIVASGLEPPVFHALWMQAGGVSPQSGVCAEHRLLIMILLMMCCYYEYD